MSFVNYNHREFSKCDQKEMHIILEKNCCARSRQQTRLNQMARQS